jgi:hypothetical protein
MNVEIGNEDMHVVSGNICFEFSVQGGSTHKRKPTCRVRDQALWYEGT